MISSLYFWSKSSSCSFKFRSYDSFSSCSRLSSLSLSNSYLLFSCCTSSSYFCSFSHTTFFSSFTYASHSLCLVCIFSSSSFTCLFFWLTVSLSDSFSY